MRVGILTSGGDCQALNATMRGLAKTLYANVKDLEIIGFKNGYKGLMYEDYIKMKPSDFSGIIAQGGTILGSSRCPFKMMRV
ncbi:MAG TPA: 6-phosphofructokinase, partial [Erysipelotrichaceae bacterium]|nr:6-phosphofructokinase [Erysipelotrichaceae bacterium]